jgi:hypothetical protein
MYATRGLYVKDRLSIAVLSSIRSKNPNLIDLAKSIKFNVEKMT